MYNSASAVSIWKSLFEIAGSCAQASKSSLSFVSGFVEMESGENCIFANLSLFLVQPSLQCS
jgi:hypothetical protein